MHTGRGPIVQCVYDSTSIH